jgi:mRNA-degrading endonuclease HigB of HigAB toxin-antitoxin module
MEIVFDDTLDRWAKQHPISAQTLWIWKDIVTNATWKNPNDVTKTFTKASIITAKPGVVPNSLTRVIFNIGGARLVTHIRFPSEDGRQGCVFLRWFGSHIAYDRINWTISEETNYDNKS